ncbi:DUF6468 domain-containing protein [Brevundimonas sp. M20]|uniref:DUF6468 domain-containing protein n=1 Tax=Brevundimonas sp. M20 TaxID=2591463 RepID=UPI0011464D53|nr:DUF6468 domain-containing protein [Brevundimonas sp. M20]QDH73967.1 hypothetical protein FKQ52_11375 [Brevundimonas sp. M20]
MTGMILDGVLMLLLVAALGYGVRLERKLTALRAGQLAFASAVSDLNTAAGRAEAALASLRASGQETDLLHDRIIKAREVKAQLETLIARGGEYAPARAAAATAAPRPVAPAPVAAAPVDEDDARAARMQALAERIQGMAAPARPSAAAGNVHAILGALTKHGAANQSAKQSLNQARRNLDDDLFAA